MAYVNILIYSIHAFCVNLIAHALNVWNIDIEMFTFSTLLFYFEHDLPDTRKYICVNLVTLEHFVFVGSLHLTNVQADLFTQISHIIIRHKYLSHINYKLYS